MGVWPICPLCLTSNGAHVASCPNLFLGIDQSHVRMSSYPPRPDYPPAPPVPEPAKLFGYYPPTGEEINAGLPPRPEEVRTISDATIWRDILEQKIWKAVNEFQCGTGMIVYSIGVYPGAVQVDARIPTSGGV